MNEKNKYKYISIRATNKEYLMLKKLADYEGVKMSAMIRMLIREGAWSRSFPSVGKLEE